MVTCKMIRSETGDQGTFGRFYIGDAGPSFYSGELPWRDNIPDKSCIPVGTYPCKWIFSNHFNRNVYHVLGIQGRDQTGKMANVEIHPGNFCGDTEKGFKSDVLGCLLLGNQKGVDGNQKAVLDSKAAIAHFESVMNGEDFMLEISEAYGATT